MEDKAKTKNTRQSFLIRTFAWLRDSDAAEGPSAIVSLPPVEESVWSRTDRPYSCLATCDSTKCWQLQRSLPSGGELNARSRRGNLRRHCSRSFCVPCWPSPWCGARRHRVGKPPRLPSVSIKRQGDYAQSSWADAHHPLRQLPQGERVAPDQGESGIRSRQDQISAARYARKSGMHAVPREAGVHGCREELPGLSCRRAPEKDGHKLCAVSHRSGLECRRAAGQGSPEPLPATRGPRGLAMRRLSQACRGGAIPGAFDRLYFLSPDRFSEDHQSESLHQ